MLKIIHTGDIHLGAKFSSFGEKAGQQRQALLGAFKKVIDTAILKKAQLVLISGDLFDSNFPSYDTVSLVKSEFKKLDEFGIFVAVLPGTHDCLVKDSIFKREDFTEGLSHIYVFDDEKVNKKYFPELDLMLYGRANTSNKSHRSPLAFLEKMNTEEENAKYKVAMAHGSLRIEGKSAEDDWPFDQGEIDRSKMDYIALGHWHGAQDFSFREMTRAWYCGSPEITYKEGKGGLGQGYVLEVDIMDKVMVKPEKITEKKIEEVDIDASLFSSTDELYDQIKKLTDINTILILSINGLLGSDMFLNKERIEEDFRDSFFHIKVKLNTSLKMDEITEKDYPEEMVLGKFVRIMQEKIDKAKNEEEKNILEEALQLGLAELEGKEVL